MLFWTTLKSLEYGLVDIHILRFPIFLRFLGFFPSVLPLPAPTPPPPQPKTSFRNALKKLGVTRTYFLRIEQEPTVMYKKKYS